MQKETRFKTKVVTLLKSIPGLWIVKAQQVSIRGTPDLLICANGHFVAWELKVGANDLSDLQRWNLANIKKAGGVARMVTPENLDECLEDLRTLL